MWVFTVHWKRSPENKTRLGPVHTGREHANLRAIPLMLLLRVWTLQFATAGSVCACASGVDWASAIVTQNVKRNLKTYPRRCENILGFKICVEHSRIAGLTNVKFLGPIHTGRRTRRARKFECFFFNVVCIQCGHPHSHQQVPFAEEEMFELWRLAHACGFDADKRPCSLLKSCFLSWSTCVLCHVTQPWKTLHPAMGEQCAQVLTSVAIRVHLYDTKWRSINFQKK